MSWLFPNYSRKNFEIIKGNGCKVYDQNNQEYLDLTSGIGVTNLGHNHPELKKALLQQINNIWHMPNLYHSEIQEQVACKLANQKDYVAFFCNSGTEANEAAIKLAKKATGRNKIISFWQSFHGRTFGSMSVTGQANIQAGFGLMLQDVAYFPFNEIDELKEALDEKVAAVIVELIQGESGIHVAYQGWIKELAHLCQQNGTLLIVDEVQTGIGRCGSLFAYEQYGITPDIITSAKALANGLPVGAMLANKKYANAFSPGSHGSTFGGNKLALSVANQVLDYVQSAEIVENVKMRSQQFFDGLAHIQSNKLIDIRGKGLMIGIELTDEYVLQHVMLQLEKEGVLTLKAGKNVLRLLPPLTISQEEIDFALDKIAKVLVG